MSKTEKVTVNTGKDEKDSVKTGSAEEDTVKTGSDKEEIGKSGIDEGDTVKTGSDKKDTVKTGKTGMAKYKTAHSFQDLYSDVTQHLPALNAFDKVFSDMVSLSMRVPFTLLAAGQIEWLKLLHENFSPSCRIWLSTLQNAKSRPLCVENPVPEWYRCSEVPQTAILSFERERSYTFLSPKHDES